MTNSPSVTHLGIVQINVTDLDEAWRFYVGTLGFRGVQTLGPGKAFELALSPGAPRILVYPVQTRPDVEYSSQPGVTLVFFTANIHAKVAEWKNHGVQFLPIAWAQDESGVAESPFGPFIAFRDPAGNVHELLEPKELVGD